MESFGRGARAATLEPVDVRAVAAVLRRAGVGVGEDVPSLALIFVRARVHVLIRRVQHIGVERVEVVVPLLAVQAFPPELVVGNRPLR